jgi:hypothetical protein
MARIATMRTRLTVGVVTLVWALGATAQGEIPERQMNVRQGPETVFDRPPAEIFSVLEGAKATGENGRVGAELVFWGYEQRDGRRVFLFACAIEPDVDCATRVPAICPAAASVLETRETNGKTVRRNCRTVGVATPGDPRPGCDDRLTNASLLAGIVSCG